MRNFLAWFYGDIRRAIKQADKGEIFITATTEWSHKRLIHYINTLLGKGYDVTMQTYSGSHFRQFALVKKGTGLYVSENSENFRPFPTYPGAHRHFK